MDKIVAIYISVAYHTHKNWSKNECKSILTLVTSACFSVGETSEGGGIRPPPFKDTEWSDQKIVIKRSF